MKWRTSNIQTSPLPCGRGIHRGTMVKTYEELLDDIRSFEGHYKTVVIDTCGALIDLMKDWAMRNEPSANKKSGGFSQQGYGFVKTEFLRLSADLRKKFNVIFLSVSLVLRFLRPA